MLTKLVTSNKIWHSALNFYWHHQKLVNTVGLEKIEKDREYQRVREARVGAVLCLIMFEKLKKVTYFQLFKPDPPDLLLMHQDLKTGNREITQVEVTHYTGNPTESLLERVKRKDPPGSHFYSENFILTYNIGIGLHPDTDEVREYLHKNRTPFPIWLIQEIPSNLNTTAKLTIIDSEVYETQIDIGSAAFNLKKLRCPDIIHSKRAGSLKNLKIEKKGKFYKAPWETFEE